MAADFLISYTEADEGWAEWTTWELEHVGFSCRFQKWDFPPGSNFVLGMQQAIEECERTAAILSKAYFESRFGAAEWAAALAVDPTGTSRKLLPIRVEECERKGLFKSIVSIDLFGKNEALARESLLTAARGARAKPVWPPMFPGARPFSRFPLFPGGLEKTEEGVKVYRARDGSTKNTRDLAWNLMSQAQMLETLRRNADALSIIDEALKHYRDLAGSIPMVYLVDVAWTLNTKARVLQSLNRNEDALEATDEAAQHYATLAEVNAVVHRRDVAWTVSMKAYILEKLRRFPAAVQCASEAVEHYEALVALDVAFDVDLVWNLERLANLLVSVGKPAEAKARREEAAALSGQAVQSK